MKKYLLLILAIVYSFGFDYFKFHNINEFKNFRIYKVKDSYIERILKMKKGDITSSQKQNLIYLYEKEKMIRDVLLVLNNKYSYPFMPYIATLTQQHLFILEDFFKKYDIPIPNDMYIVGKFENTQIQKEYKKYLLQALKDKKLAAKLSVKFMKELLKTYKDVLISGVPRDIRRMLLKLKAFNRKVLYRFKKGLRNIEIGLPIE